MRDGARARPSTDSPDFFFWCREREGGRDGPRVIRGGVTSASHGREVEKITTRPSRGPGTLRGGECREPDSEAPGVQMRRK